MTVNSLSVFMPAYNEGKNVGETLEEVLKVLQTLDIKEYEVIVVNDGSKDQTAEVVKQWEKKDKHVRLVEHDKNKGYGEAVKTGFYASKFNYIVFIDADGQFDFTDVHKLLNKIDKADVVVGYRMNRQDNFMRIFNGWGWTQLSNILFGLHLKDVDCAFKLFKREVIETIPHLEAKRGAMINPETLAKAKKAGFKIEEVGVKHFPRKDGKSTGGNLEVIISSFWDLIKFWVRLNLSRKYAD
jgi:glycosyltransferase involved in cell wall biosynthesis